MINQLMVFLRAAFIFIMMMNYALITFDVSTNDSMQIEFSAHNSTQSNPFLNIDTIDDDQMRTTDESSEMSIDFHFIPWSQNILANYIHSYSIWQPPKTIILA